MGKGKCKCCGKENCDMPPSEFLRRLRDAPGICGYLCEECIDRITANREWLNVQQKDEYDCPESEQK